MKKYSRWQRFMVWLTGRVELGYRYETGVYYPRKFYLAKCPRHGYFEDTLHGFDDYMNCPECMKAAK